MDAREAECARIERETGAVFIPPYNHPSVISGQGTLALELAEQVRRLCLYSHLHSQKRKRHSLQS